MSDGVSVGSSAPAINPNILMEIFGASDTVQARIAQYQAAKTASEKALADLRLGQSAQAAVEDANAKHAEAQATLDDAKKQADALLASAKAQAKDLIEDSNSKRDQAFSDISKARAAHEDWAASVKSDLDGKQKSLDASLASAQADKDAAAKLAGEARQAVAAAKSAKDDHDALVAQMTSDAAKLQQALGAMSIPPAKP